MTSGSLCHIRGRLVAAVLRIAARVEQIQNGKGVCYSKGRPVER